MHRLRVGILKTKWLKELKLKKKLRAATRFAEKKQGNAIKQQLDNTF